MTWPWAFLIVGCIWAFVVGWVGILIFAIVNAKNAKMGEQNGNGGS